MIVNFNLFKNKVSWDSVIHQLNSDVLMRHVLMNGNVDSIDISFSYCEESNTGEIKNCSNELIGCFLIS